MKSIEPSSPVGTEPARPGVSVCLATYNGAAYLKEQLVSICDQLSAGDEVVISDDASTDGCLGLLDSLRIDYPQVAIRVVGNSRAGGVVPNFERAIAASAGDIVILADQDDVWLAGRVELVRRSLRNCDLVMLDGQVVDGQLNPRGVTVFEFVGVRSGFWSNFAKNSFIGCCMAFRREFLVRLLPFPAGLPWHDWYIGLFVELVGKVERVESSTLLYRRHGANHSPTGEKSRNGLLKKIAMRFLVGRAVLVALMR